MKHFSRKLVAILVQRNILSTLGTNYAKSDMSNIVTKSFGQNGYIKFSNKFIVQWGFATDNQTYYKQTVYLPISFLDGSSYVVVTSARSAYTDYYVGRTIASLSASSFVVSVNQANKEPFYWIAIGYGR